MMRKKQAKQLVKLLAKEIGKYVADYLRQDDKPVKSEPTQAQATVKTDAGLADLPEGWNYYRLPGGYEIYKPIIIDYNGECWIEYPGDMDCLNNGTEIHAIDGWRYFYHREWNEGPTFTLLRSPENKHYIRLNDPHGQKS